MPETGCTDIPVTGGFKMPGMTAGQGEGGGGDGACFKADKKAGSPWLPRQRRL